MSKIISADDLFDEIEWSDEKPEDTDWLESIIDEMPDAVLRCKNCKNRVEKGVCSKFKISMSKEDFCSKGEPSEIFAIKSNVRARIQKLSTNKLLGDWTDSDGDNLAVFKSVYEYLNKLDKE